MYWKKNFSSSLEKISVNYILVITIYLADEEFINLCFEFGLEMEQGDAAKMNMTRVDDNGTAIDISKEEVYKLEVAANRYDLLCLEGISQTLRSYLGLG